MLPINLEAITEADLTQLVESRQQEGKNIEYKERLPGNADLDKKEFLADVSSFANTAGGDILYGIIEEAGLPTGIPGIQITDADSLISRMDNILRDGLEPRIQHTTRAVSLSNGNRVIIIRVRQSWIKPHRVVAGGDGKFFARNSSGKYSLDVGELRQLFTLSETIEKRIHDFRIDRVAEIESGNTPVPLYDGRGRIILHLIPLESFSTRTQIPQTTLLGLLNDADVIRPMYPGSGWNTPQMTLNGILAWAGRAESVHSYIQLFRNGVIEVVEAAILDRRDGDLIPSGLLEPEIVDTVARMLRSMERLGLQTPIYVFETLTNVGGMRLRYDTTGIIPHDDHPIREQNLFLPEVVVEQMNADLPTLFKSTFDLVWNATGIPASKNYDRNGNWHP